MLNKIISALVDVNWNNFISGHRYVPEIISEAYCSSWIFSDMFSVAWNNFSNWKKFYFSFRRGYVWNKTL